MFTKLKQSGIASNDPTALSFDLFVHTCDVAGALGHVNNQSSLVYIEDTHHAMQAMGVAVRIFSNPNKREWDAYNYYLGVRASWLGLSPQDKSDRVLARVGAMLRLFTLEDGTLLRKAVLEIDQGLQDRISVQLDAKQEDLSSKTPTYMPALLVNLSNNQHLQQSTIGQIKR
jgi:hypothetical protein